MELRRLFGGMFVVGSAQALDHPDVNQVENVLQCTVAGADFLVLYFRKIKHLLAQVRLTDCAIHTRFILFVECNLRRRRGIVFNPQAHAFVSDADFGVERL